MEDARRDPARSSCAGSLTARHFPTGDPHLLPAGAHESTEKHSYTHPTPLSRRSGDMAGVGSEPLAGAELPHPSACWPPEEVAALSVGLLLWGDVRVAAERLLLRTVRRGARALR